MKNKFNFKSIILTLTLLTLGVGQIWAGQGYNGESHVYLNVDGTTKYYKVSTESWSTGSSLPGTWGGELKSQTFNKVLNIQIKGGAVGGWTENGGNISGTLYYKVTTNTTTPSSGWTSVGGINANYTTKSGNNCFRYKNDYSVNVTPTTPGTYYLHIKITDGDSNNRTSYVKIVVPSFTVAGTTAVMGSDWSPTDTGNDMAFSSGTTYTLTKSNVELSTGTTYECKVVLNHSWDAGSYPGSNKTFTVDANGHYNVTFSFDASSKAVDVSTTRLYAVIYNDNGKTSGSVPATSYHANGATVTVASNSGSLAKTGYSFGGWNTNSSGTGTNYTAGSGTFTMGSSDKDLFAKWTENMSTVSFVASPTGKGTFQVGGSTVTSTTAGVTTTRSVTAVPISGYHFVSWAITGGATISSTTTNPTTVTGGGAGTAATLTATFAADDVYTLTVAAGTGISAVTGTTNDIKAAQNIVITATVATGYTWSTWTKTGAGTLSTYTAGTKNQTVTVGTAGDITLTASATENMSSLTTSCHYDAGNPSYAIPTKSKSSIGIATTATLTATTPSTGYTFAGWTLSSNLVVTSGNAATDLSITVRTNGNGVAATAQANYAEDLSTPYVLNGGSAFGGSTWSQNLSFNKRSGESTGSVAYLEVPITTAWTDATSENYHFKIVQGSTWCGLDGAGNPWDYWSDSGEQTLVVDGGDNIRMSAGVLGTYTIKLDYSTPASPKITITWPVALSIYRSNPTDGTNIGDHAWNSMPTSTSYRWLLDLAANTTYEFKINDKGSYYGHNTTINTTISNRIFATGTNDTKLITKSAGTFTFTWNATDHQLTLQYPKSVTAGASPLSVYDEGTTTLTGYASELGSGSHTITYEFYKGTTLTDAYKVGTETNTVNDTYQQASHDVTVDFDGNAMSQVYTVQIKEGGVVLGTNTVTVYRKWDIYVHDVDSWNAMYYYVYDNASGAHREDWPGLNYSSNKITGSTTWYIVTLDSQYPHFILDNNAGNKQTWGSGVYENDITDFAAGSYWYVEYKETNDGKRYYDLHSIEITDPTITLSASVASCKDITLTGNVTNCGGDGMFASDMKEVYFHVAGTKNSATTTSTTDGTFTKTISNATAGTTNTLQAFAENIHGTGSSSVLHYTNVTLDRQSGTTGTTAVTAVEDMAMPAGATAPGRTGYTFGGYYASTGGSGKQYYNTSMGSANNWDQTSKDKTIYAKWTAKSYDVILDVNGGSCDNQTVRATFDAAMPTTLKGGSDPIAARTRTGYNFDGYWANTNGTGTQYYTSALASNHNWDVDNNEQHIYAKWNAKQCTVTFDYQLSAEGHGDAGTLSNVTATYDAAMPALTGNMPTAANGYCFMGFYSGTGGTGTKYYNADKSSANNWAVNTESNTTLYAYYKKAEITAVTLNATAFEPVEAGDEGYVVANPTIAPTPAGTTAICWELLYDNDNPVTGRTVIADPEVGKPNQVKFSIAGLAAGGYKIRATLHTGDGACGTGTTLSVEEASFTIASDFTVTILYKCGDATIKSSTTNPGKALEGTSITAPDIIGYTFSKWKAGDGVTIDGADASGEKATATITYTANYNGNLTAVYTRKRMIYFYNTLGWSDVYVYFYKNDSYWDNSGNNRGTGANTTYTYINTPYSEGLHGSMTQIEGSNIWYFDCEEASIPEGYKDVVFTEVDQHGEGYFSNNKVTRRGDYKKELPMFVPLADQKVETHNSTANYYNNGYWMNYPENTGYTLRIYSSWDAASPSREYPFPYSEDKKMPLKVDVEFNFTGQTWFMIYRNDNQLLGKNYIMKQGWHETDLDSGSDQKINLKTSTPGVYKFTLSFLNVGTVETPNYKYKINVEYPVGVGDYRIYYTDEATWSLGTAHSAGWCHMSDIIPINSGEEEKADTVSLFVSYGSSPSAKFQKVTEIDNETGAVTWADVEGGTVSLSGITKAGVYNFILTQPAGGASISLSKTELYEGHYYIRTDNAGNTKWDNYRASDHQMVYTEFSMSAANTTGDKYSHYFTSWCERSTNIKFCIANDYSSCISDTLGQDIGNPYKNTDADGWLKSDGADIPLNDRYSANVRFMYNEKTNKISRAYVGSATNAERKFLILEGNDVLKGDDDEAITDWESKYALILADKQNWIYERTLKIKPGTRFKLYSNYAQKAVDPDSAQYFRGAYESGAWAVDDTKSVILIDGSGGYQMARVIYDFKTNRLMTAWIPSGSDVSGDMQINADVLVEREHHEPAQYITFANESSQLSGVKTVYGAMKFNRWILNNRGGSSDDDPDHGKTAEQLATYHAPLSVGQQKSLYERSLYFISFPFDVNASEIFGFGHYWDEWYLEYYDGLNRAKNGYWEDSPPNWKYVTPSMLNDFVLKANEGYILGLDLDFMKADNFDFWSNGISTVELFFPSTTTQETLKQTNCTIPALGDEYRCKINRGTTEGDRRVKDSYWRCLGVPSFNIYNTSLTDGSGNPITWQPDGNTLPFIYAWNKADNTLTAQSTSTFTFLPMHAYLVQNGGEIRWENVSAKGPSPIVARRVNEQPVKEYEWRLALMSDSILIDQTYIKMSNLEQVTDSFDFNQDLIKEFNTYRSDIYTYIGNERVAANSMPLQTEQTTVIPVGVKIKTAGDYTFAMPDGTNGVGVTLIDTETGVRTSLGLMDYTVTLTAGSFNQRFFLEISPVSNTPTDIEQLDNGDWTLDKVRKVLIDNKLFIIKDGEVYDARGAMVK